MDKLPANIALKLRPIVTRKGYCSLAHLLSAPPEPWQPACPLQMLADSAVSTAENRRAVLAPILAAADAQVVTISELVDRALTAFDELDRGGSGGDRAVRRWIEAAIDRDRGLWNWERLEIYLDEKPPLKSSEDKDAELFLDGGGNALGAALLAIEKQEGAAEGREATAWNEAFHWFVSLVASGASESKAKRKVASALASSKSALLTGTPAKRFATWKRQFEKWEQNGQCADAFIDRRAFNSKRPDYDLTDAEKAALRAYRLKKGSLDQALRQFVKHPDCRTETRRAIQETRDEAAGRGRSPNWPMSLRRAGYVKVEEKALFRGSKAFQNVEQISHRGLWYFGAEGEKLPVKPNTVWESDDMSSNEPFVFLDPETRKTCDGRQTLCTQDVYSRAWLSAMPLGRVRDAYRAEDIADHFLVTVLTNGLPDVWRLERGVWENNIIDGIPLPDGTRWGGLRALFHVERAHKSRGKGGCEVSFSKLQTLLAHESLSIGRKRGEFEKGTKTMLKVKAGDERAAEKCWSIGQYANAIQAAMRDFNGLPMKRRVFGRKVVVPADLYRNAVRRDCPPGELWRFCPVKKLATVRHGRVEVSIPHYPRPFCFRVNGVQDPLYFEHGYPVLIAFHPGHPERGCHIFNAERGARNRDNVPFAEFMLLASLMEEVAQFGGAFNDPELQARKRANAAVAQEFRSIVNSANAISVVRDSHGQSVRREVGSHAPSVIGEASTAQSIKAQRAEQRKKDADAYLDKAASLAKSTVECDALLANANRKEQALIDEGRAYREPTGEFVFLG